MLTLTQGDTRPLTGRCDLRDPLTAVAAPANLSQATRLEVRIARVGQPALLVRDATMVDAAGGTWSLQWLAGDGALITPGLYLVSTRAFFPSSSTTFALAQFRVRPSL